MSRNIMIKVKMEFTKKKIIIFLLPQDLHLVLTHV